MDPAGPDKDRLEAQMQDDLLKFWQEQRIRIKEELDKRVPKDRKVTVMLPDAYWVTEETEMLAYMLPTLVKAAEGGVALHIGTIAALVGSVYGDIGIGIDWTLPYTAAADWARKYGGKLVGGITRTTKDRIGVMVGNWIETPGAPVSQLWEQLMSDEEYTFSLSRAKLIATTEVTAAYSRGEMVGARELEKEGYFEYQKVWQTNNDDIVCDICKPMHNVPVDGVYTNFETPAGSVKGPPAHPGCRCWHNVIPSVPQ